MSTADLFTNHHPPGSTPFFFQKSSDTKNIALQSHVFRSSTLQDQLFTNTDNPGATASAQSPPPPPASASAAAAMTDPDVAAEGCPSHAAEVLSPPVLPHLSSLMSMCVDLSCAVTQWQAPPQHALLSAKQKHTSQRSRRSCDPILSHQLPANVTSCPNPRTQSLTWTASEVAHGPG